MKLQGRIQRHRGLGGLLLLALMAGPLSGAAQLQNEAEPLPGVTTSGQPGQAELATLAAKGYATVIDLRGENEDRGFDEASVVEALGMDYVSLPVVGADGVSYDNAAMLQSLLENADGPVLIHCATSNRVGALMALRESLLGAGDDVALARGVEAGLSSPALVETVRSRLDER